MKLFTRKDGKEIFLLTPKEKSMKFAGELKTGVKVANDGTVKKLEDGSYVGLDKSARAYRSGYLDARKDETKLWHWKERQPKK